MTDLATIGFRGDTSGIDKVNKHLNKLGKTGEKTEGKLNKSSKGISKSFKIMAGAIAAAYAGIQAVSELVTTNREFGVLNAQLITATGNAKNAAKAFDALSQFAARTPYDLQQTTRAFTQLVNLGLTPSEAALESYGNTAAAMGKDLSQLVEAVADATTGEFERLKEFGIKSKSEGDRVTFTFRGVSKTVAKEAAAIESYLMRIGQVEFAGAMANRVEELDGIISNFEDTWDGLIRTIGQAGATSVIEDAVRGITSAIQYVDDLIKSGAIANFFEAWIIPFQSFINAFSAGFDWISSFISDKTEGWWESFKTFILNVQTNVIFIPETIKTMVQRTGLELSALGDIAMIYGEMFADLLVVNFKKTVDIAGVYVDKLISVLNPLSDEYDLKSNLSQVSRFYNSTIGDIVMGATQRADTVRASLDKETTAIKVNLQEQKNEYKERITQTDDILEAYRAERIELGKLTKDRLTAFKITPTGGGGAANFTKDIKEAADATVDLLSAFQALSDQGSKDYQRLAVAINAVTAAQKIQAAVAAATISTVTAAATAGLSLIGTLDVLFDDDFEDISIKMQQQQGLNEWNDKADSINDSVEITADATKDLVGINTDMLKTLINLQSSVSGAAGIIARDVTMPTATANINENLLSFITDTSFASVFGSNFITEALDFISFNWAFDAIGKWLGGSSKVVNEGIMILGNTLSSLIDDVSVAAFQTIKYKKWKFGSSKSKTAYQDITDEVGSQFALVFEALADSVAQGAKALGLSEQEIENAISSFMVDTITISTKGMSTSEIMTALEDVFSQVFNEMALAVVPWIREFQDAGEDLGATISRVASEVAIADYLVDVFGTTFGDKMADPRAYAEAADNLTSLVGGVESLSDATSGFIDSFATDEQQFEILSNALFDAFREVGLNLPATSSGLYDLVGAIDASTESGQKQLATILNLTGTADAYYGLLEKQNKAMASLSGSLSGAVMDIYNISDGIAQVSLDAALAAARLGDFDLAESLDLSDYTLKQSDFATLADFNIAQAEAANKLFQISELAAEQTGDIQTQQLDVLREINANLIAVYQPERDVAVREEMAAQRKEIEQMKTLNQSMASSAAMTTSILKEIRGNGLLTYTETA